MMRVEGFPTSGGGVDLDLAQGDIVLLDGPNGSGKTSLLRALAGLDAPLVPAAVHAKAGDPRRAPAATLPARATLAFQDARDGLAGLTVRGEFSLRKLTHPPTLAPLRTRDVATLSSGEARRVALALAEASRAPLLLLDEPAEGLDAEGRERLRALVRLVSRRGAVVAADHAGLLAPLVTRTLQLGQAAAGRLVAMPPAGRAPIVGAEVARIQTRGLDVRLPRLELPCGFHVVVGANGAGKSTLLHRLAGLEDSRGVSVRGTAPRPGVEARLSPARARDLFLSETVEEELDGVDEDILRRLVPEALRARHPLALSGGESQRVALARTLGVQAPLYLLDEPEAHLDVAGRAALTEVIARRIREGACIVAATHDAPLIAIAHTRIRLEAHA